MCECVWLPICDGLVTSSGRTPMTLAHSSRIQQGTGKQWIMLLTHLYFLFWLGNIVLFTACYVYIFVVCTTISSGKDLYEI